MARHVYDGSDRFLQPFSITMDWGGFGDAFKATTAAAATAAAAAGGQCSSLTLKVYYRTPYNDILPHSQIFFSHPGLLRAKPRKRSKEFYRKSLEFVASMLDGQGPKTKQLGERCHCPL